MRRNDAEESRQTSVRLRVRSSRCLSESDCVWIGEEAETEKGLDRTFVVGATLLEREDKSSNTILLLCVFDQMPQNPPLIKVIDV